MTNGNNQGLVERTRQLPAVQTKPKALEVMASRLNVDPSKLMGTLKATVFQKASDEELVALVVVANEYGLNPFLKELYAFPAKGGGIVPIVGVDGWNKMMTRQPDFDGIEFSMVDGDDGNPVSCTATIYLKTRSKPVAVTEYFSECYRDTEPWKKMPRRMLRHKALIQGSRVAFGFSGVYDEDEAIDVVTTVVSVSDARSEAKADKRAALLPAEQSQPVSHESIHTKFQAWLDSHGILIGTFLKWGEKSDNIKDGLSKSSIEEVDGEILTRLLKAEKGLLTQLKAAQ